MNSNVDLTRDIYEAFSDVSGPIIVNQEDLCIFL